MSRRPWTLAAMLLAALAAAGMHGCGGEDEPPESTGATGGDSGSPSGGSGGFVWGGGGSSAASGSGSAGGSSGGAAGSAGCPGPAPPDAPPDWERFPGWCECAFYYPGAKGKMPDPVEWEPCAAPAPSNPTCRRMRTPWSDIKEAMPVGNRFWFDSTTGKSYLMFGRNGLGGDPTSKTRYRMIADADGPVLSAFYENTLACGLRTEALDGGRYAYWVGLYVDPGPNQSEGVIAGPIGSPPDTVLSFPVGALHMNWRVTSNWLVRWSSGLHGRAWGSTTEVTVQQAKLDPEGYPAYGPRGAGDSLFWEVGDLKYHGIMSWTQAFGGRSLVRYLGDYTQGAGNFATDGGHMVWTHGEGKAPNDWEYPKRSVMTAPFTTDPDAVKQTAKRLRSDPGQIGLDWFVVGCGYAARVYWENAGAGGAASQDLMIVRLSDGVSWIYDAPPLSTGFRLSGALGITCDEVFAHAQFPDDAVTIIRVRLDSLGPGIPPD
ncbi:MAG: hypothetical protein IPM35_23960 [Myxococcales bacterium]|nr:hypothetical protein [Myxococcales bacterium]